MLKFPSTRTVTSSVNFPSYSTGPFTSTSFSSPSSRIAPHLTASLLSFHRSTPKLFAPNLSLNRLISTSSKGLGGALIGAGLVSALGGGGSGGVGRELAEIVRVTRRKLLLLEVWRGLWTGRRRLISRRF